MFVQYSNGKVTWISQPFEYRTLWTINRLLSVRFSDHHSNTWPFDNRTQIYHLNTRLACYSDPYCGYGKCLLITTFKEWHKICRSFKDLPTFTYVPYSPGLKQLTPKEVLLSATCLALISVNVRIGSSPEFSAKAKGIDSKAFANPRKAYCSIVLIWNIWRLQKILVLKLNLIFD